MTSSSSPAPMTVAGLFAGIGGLELGLERAGLRTEYLCELWGPARAVLSERFPGVPLDLDVREVKRLPRADVVTAGFPCTDLSQAGRTAGIAGEHSGLVRELFRLLRAGRRSLPTWVVIENVRNMTVLGSGSAMAHVVQGLEDLGYRWAYRVVDSRFSGVPQRRQRVLFVASRTEDPRGALFADEAGEPPAEELADDAFGFYWTEGLRGLGWARDAVPTLKGGSSLGIPSAPGIWVPAAEQGRRVVSPRLEEAEALQGFPPGWTGPVEGSARAAGTRWKLVGNAVTVGVAQWLGGRLAGPGEPLATGRELAPGERWPLAAWGAKGRRFAAEASMWPLRLPYAHLSSLVDLPEAPALSLRATGGFYQRLCRGGLKVAPPEFRDDIAGHLASHGLGVMGHSSSADGPGHLASHGLGVMGRRALERDEAAAVACLPRAAGTGGH
jgi:DNA (cytosine-5)-methyltransferase 1